MFKLIHCRSPFLDPQQKNFSTTPKRVQTSDVDSINALNRYVVALSELCSFEMCIIWSSKFKFYLYFVSSTLYAVPQL